MMNDAETWSEFRFLKNDLFRLKDALQIPDTIRTYNRLRVSGIEGLCILLKRLAYTRVGILSLFHDSGDRFLITA